MPRGNRTGPYGMGQMTGIGAGFCAGYNTPGFINPGVGRFFKKGGGIGRGFWGMMLPRIPFSRWSTYLPPAAFYGQFDPEQELDYLKQEAKDLENYLQKLKQQISKTESEKKKK